MLRTLFEAGAHGGHATVARAGPVRKQGAQTCVDGREITPCLLHLGGLPFDQRPYFATRPAAGEADRDDVADLRECESDATRLGDEREHADGLVAVQSIAARGA